MEESSLNQLNANESVSSLCISPLDQIKNGTNDSQQNILHEKNQIDKETILDKDDKDAFITHCHSTEFPVINQIADNSSSNKLSKLISRDATDRQNSTSQSKCKLNAVIKDKFVDIQVQVKNNSSLKPCNSLSSFLDGKSEYSNLNFNAKSISIFNETTQCTPTPLGMKQHKHMPSHSNRQPTFISLSDRLVQLAKPTNRGEALTTSQDACELLLNENYTHLSFDDVNALHSSIPIPSATTATVDVAQGQDFHCYMKPSIHKLRTSLTVPTSILHKSSHSSKPQSQSHNYKHKSPPKQPNTNNNNQNQDHLFVQRGIDYKGPIFDPEVIMNHLLAPQGSHNNDRNIDLPKSLSQYKCNEFLRMNSLEVFLIVYDIHMQIVGTYDLYADADRLPKGITACPPYLNAYLNTTKHYDRQNKKSLVNLFEFDLNILDPNIFSIVPVIISTQTRGSDADPLDCTCDYYISYDPTTSLPGEGHDISLGQNVSNRINFELNYSEVDQYGTLHTRRPPGAYAYAKADGLEEEYLQWKCISTHNNINKTTSPNPKIFKEFTKVCKGFAESYSKGYIDSVIHDQENDVSSSPLEAVGSSDKTKNSNMYNTFSPPLKGRSRVRFMSPQEEKKWMTKSWSLTDITDSSDLYATPTKRDKINSSPNEPPLQYSTYPDPSNHLYTWGHIGSSKFKQNHEGKLSAINSSSSNTDSINLIEHATLGSGVIPFVLFRTSEYSNGWHFRSQTHFIKQHSKRFKIIEEVTQFMIANNILPYHVLHVEHCINCESHQKSTRHIPGSYEKLFQDISKEISLTLPPTIIHSNSTKGLCTSNSNPINPEAPRVGSFEITVRPFQSEFTKLVFSKVHRRSFPTSTEVCSELSSLLLAKTVAFNALHMPTLEVLLLDAYYKKPVSHALINVFKVNVNITSLSKKHEDTNMTTPSKLTKTASQLQIIGKSSDEYLSARSLAQQSQRYSYIRAWGKKDISIWLKANGASNEVVLEANRAGVIDGASFIASVSVTSFARWGVKSKRDIIKLQSALHELLIDDTEKEDQPSQKIIADLVMPMSIIIPPRKILINTLVDLKDINIEGLTSSAGYFKCVISNPGSYLISIYSPSLQEYTSHVINISQEDTRVGYAALVKPQKKTFLIIIPRTINSERIKLFYNVPIINLASSIKYTIPAIAWTGGASIEYSKSSQDFCQHMNKKYQTSKSSHSNNLHDVLLGEVCDIPCGNYYSPIDGIVFKVVNIVSKSKKKSNEVLNLNIFATNSFLSFEKIKEEIFTSDKYSSLGEYLLFSEVQLMKYENRVLNHGIKCLQKVFRLHKLKLFARIVERVSINKVLRLQTFFRCKFFTWRYRKILRSVQFVQCNYRGYICRKEMQDFISIRIFKKRAGKLQCLSIVELVQCHVTCSHLVDNRLATQEIELMAIEEMYIKQFYTDEVEYFNTRLDAEKKLMLEKLLAVEAKRLSHAIFLAKKVVTIQKEFRRYTQYWKWKHILWIVIKLQRLFRRYINIKHIKRIKGNAFKFTPRDIKPLVTSHNLIPIETIEEMSRLTQQKNPSIASLDDNEDSSSPSHYSGSRSLMSLSSREFGTLKSRDKHCIPQNNNHHHHRVESNPKFLQMADLVFLENYTQFSASFPQVDESSQHDNQSIQIEEDKHAKYIVPTHSLMDKLLYPYFRLEVRRPFVLPSFPLTSSVKDLLRARRSTKSSPLPMTMSISSTCRSNILKLRNNISIPNIVSSVSSPIYVSKSLISRAMQVLLSNKMFQQKRVPDAVRDVHNNKNLFSESALVQLQAVVRGVLARSRLYREKEINMALLKIREADSPNQKITDSNTDDDNNSNIQNTSSGCGNDVFFDEFLLNQSVKADSNYDTFISNGNNALNNLSEFLPPIAMADRADEEHGRGNAISTPVSIPVSIQPKRFRPNLTIITDADILKTSSPSPKNDGKHTPKESPLSLSGTTSLLSSTLNHNSSVSGVMSLMSPIRPGTPLHRVIDGLQSVKEAISNKASVIKIKTQLFLAQRQTAYQKMLRRQNGEISPGDAILNIRGTFMPSLAELEKQWYIAVYPKSQPLKHEKGDLAADILPEDDSQKEILSERIMSMPLFPFSKESLQSLSFFTHLTDLISYTDIEIVIFLEKGSSVAVTLGLEENSLRHGLVSSVCATPQTVQDSKRKFIPAFRGSCHLGRGAVFGPHGGRMHFFIRPNVSEIMQLPAAASILNSLSYGDGLRMMLTLLPLSMPSSKFLGSFRGVNQPAPVYPSSLADCELFEPCTVEWDVISGVAVCSASFHNKILVSVKNKFTKYDILEYDNHGKFLGKVLSVDDDIGTILIILAGHSHIICGTSSGQIIYFKTLGKIIDRDKKYQWTSTIAVRVHPESSDVSIGCVITHANMDIAITVDRNNGIGLCFFHNGECVRHYYNQPFLSSRITGLAAIGSRLYASVLSGSVCIFSLSSIFDGDYSLGNQLQRFLIAEESVFSQYDCAAMCIAVASPNGVLGLKDEDEVRREEECRAKKFQSVLEDRVVYDIIEGHILLVGGGNDNPVVKVFHPHPTGFREIITLKGHSKAVSKIIVEAAGRYIITASSDDKNIVVWDGLSFTCEKRFENVNIGDITLGHNCLIATSFKAPYLRLWTSVYPVFKRNVSQSDLNKNNSSNFSISGFISDMNRSIVADDNNDSFAVNAEGTEDAVQTDITTVRSFHWCFAMLKGGSYIPSKSLVACTYFHEDARIVLTRWNFQYYRAGSATVAKFVDLRSFKSKGVRHSETPRARARRQFESTDFFNEQWSQESEENPNRKLFPGKEPNLRNLFSLTEGQEGVDSPRSNESSQSKKNYYEKKNKLFSQESKQSFENESYSSGDEDVNTKLKKINRMMRHAQISDSSDEKEEEMPEKEVRKMPSRDEIKRKKMLREAATERKERQKKLRPRMIFHLNDEIDDDD